MPAPKKSTGKTIATAALAAEAEGMPAAPVAKKAAPKTAAVFKASAQSMQQGATQVVAQVDVGFGNRLTIRGQGAGLTWTTGQAMQWNAGVWSWQTTAKEDFEFKVMLNDQVWAQGPNLKGKAGQKFVFRPHF